MEITYPSVCIIILNWNGFEITKDCLYSLQNIDYSNYKVILVDNGSIDGSIPALENEFAGYIDILALGRNFGFTGGNNLGFEYAKKKYDPDFYLMLNNDTTVTKPFLSKMVAAFKNNSNCYAAVPKIYFYDNSDVLWFAGGEISYLTGIVDQYGKHKRDTGKYEVAGPTRFMNGCCALISKEALNSIGFLDNRFFANSEDTDYSLRILNTGHTIQYVPAAIIYHKVSQTFKSNRGKWLSFYLATRNLIQLQKKYLPNYMMPVFVICFSLRWVLYLTVKLFILGDLRTIKGIYQGVVDGVTGNLRFVN